MFILKLIFTILCLKVCSTFLTFLLFVLFLLPIIRTDKLTCGFCSFRDILLITASLFPHLPALPQWVRMINDTQMDSGEKLQWECKAIGRPRPTYRWIRNGLPLTSQVLLIHTKPLSIVNCTLHTVL